MRTSQVILHQVLIRNAVLSDAGAVASLMTDLGYPTAADAMRARLGAIVPDPQYATFVAESGGALVGIAGATLGRYYEKDGIYARLLVLSVSSHVRSQGIGARLAEAVERWAIDAGARDVVVNSAFHRDRAHVFYERLGYVKTGVRLVKALPV